MAKSRRAHAKRHKHINRLRARGRRINPFHKRRRHHHINPFSTRGLMHSTTAALVGAGGAILTDVAMAYAAPYLPAQLTTGWMNILTRAAAAIGVGFVAGKVVGRETGKAVAAGGLLVVAYSGLKQALAPTLGTSIKGLSGLADFGDYKPAWPGEYAVGANPAGVEDRPQLSRMGAYMRPMGAYIGRNIQYPTGGMGYYTDDLRRFPAAGAGGMGYYTDDPRRFSVGRLGAYMNPGSFVQASASPVLAKQRMAGFGGFGGASDDMF